MLEDIKKSYVKTANSSVPNWKELDVNTLCNLYIENEKDEVKKNGYFSAIVLKKWGYIGKHYINSKSSGFSIEQCYDMVLDAVMYILKMRKWLDPNNKLYGDKNAPDKCLNRCIFSARQRDYYLSNRDKRKYNYGNVSLEYIVDNVVDHTDVLGDDFSYPNEDNNMFINVTLKNIVQKMIKNNRVLEALIIDNIVNDDCYTSKVETKKIDNGYEIQKFKNYNEEFKFGKLVNNLYNYDVGTIKRICSMYSISEEECKLIEYLPTLNNDKGKLSRVIKSVMRNLSKDEDLRVSLCC